MGDLLGFYRLQKPDSEGRMLSELWGWSINELEQVHDFIQWMFPLDEPSAFNADAPLVTADDQTAFRVDPVLQANLRQSLAVFLHFLGLKRDNDGQVSPAENFADRTNVWRYSNHNWLRITRVLKSLRLLGLETDAQNFFDCLRDLHEQQGLVSSHSYGFWRDAMK